MSWNRNRQRARASLDQKLIELRPIDRYRAPPRGWIRALRDSIGMSSAQMGNILGVRSQSIDDIEKSEMNGRITLDALRRAGSAMDCTLVYALVPNTSLEGLVQERAEQLAKAAIAGVSHSMALEDQQISADLQRQMEDYIADHISERDLWRTK